MCGILGVSGQVCSLKCLSVNACANCVCLFRHRLQREFLGVVEGGWFKKNCKAMFLFICLLVKCKKKKSSTKTLCITQSINVCLWESPVSSLFPSMACRLIFRQSTCACVTLSSTCCVGIHGAGEAGACGGGSVCVSDHMQLLLLTSPIKKKKKKTLVRSASALRSRCGIPQRTRLQSDQLFKLQVSASGETQCSFVYLFCFCCTFLSLHTKWLKMP